MLKEAVYYAKMARGLLGVMRPGPVADPGAPLREHLGRREENFVAQVRDYVFAMPGHPYRTMFELAGCAYGDLETAVRREGLEKTLRKLKDSGVYLSHDELKG